MCGCFLNAGLGEVRYYEYDHSRSHWVAQRILGAGFKGYLGLDFYAG